MFAASFLVLVCKVGKIIRCFTFISLSVFVVSKERVGLLVGWW
jgi:hypothetical protein